MGDPEYKLAFDLIVRPIAEQFQPDLAIVACGFDAAAADMIGGYIVTPQMYAYMTAGLKEVVHGGRVLLCLEGGYNPRAIGECFEACLKVLLGEDDQSSEFVMESSVTICKRALLTLRNVIGVQKKYWSLSEPDAVV